MNASNGCPTLTVISPIWSNGAVSDSNFEPRGIDWEQKLDKAAHLAVGPS